MSCHRGWGAAGPGALCHPRARPAVRSAEQTRTARKERWGARSAARRLLLSAPAPLSPGWRGVGPGEAEWEVVWTLPRPGGGPDGGFAAGGLVVGIGSATPALPGVRGRAPCPGVQGGDHTLRAAGEEVGRGPLFYYCYFPLQPTKAAGPVRGQVWLGGGGFPEETLESVCVSTGAFWSPRAWSGLLSEKLSLFALRLTQATSCLYM